jgi:hypothetical protein
MRSRFEVFIYYHFIITSHLEILLVAAAEFAALKTRGVLRVLGK